MDPHILHAVEGDMNKPAPKEDRYVDFDQDSATFCIFGAVSGFAYASFCSKEEADSALKGENTPR